MKDYTNYNAYGTYETKGEDDPYAILMKMSSWNKEIRSTISDVQETLSGTIERQSQIIQDIDSINLNVLDIVSDVEGSLTRIGSLEITSESIVAQVEEIELTMGEMGEELFAAVGSISTLAGRVDLKAEAAAVDALGGRVSSAEFSVNALSGEISSKVSYSDYTGVTLVSLINQTASSVKIQAKNISLVGAVSVLSDITGNLGNIHTGYINISQDATLGHNLYLGRGGNSSIRFNNERAWLYSSGDSLTIAASYVIADGRLEAWSPVFGGGMPVITGTSQNQRLSIGLTPGGVLNIYRSDGSVASFQPM